MSTKVKMIVASVADDDGMRGCEIPVKYNDGKYADLVSIEYDGITISLSAKHLRELMGIDKKR